MGTSIRLRVPGALADRLRARCAREGVGQPVALALMLLDQNVDEDQAPPGEDDDAVPIDADDRISQTVMMPPR